MEHAGPKSPKNGPQMRFLVFDKNLTHSPVLLYTFMLDYESVNGLLTLCNNSMFGKIFVPELWSKNLLTNQCRIFLTTISHKKIEL